MSPSWSKRGLLLWARVLAALCVALGVTGIALAPFVGARFSRDLWPLEPLDVLGGLLVIGGLAGLVLLSLAAREGAAPGWSEQLQRNLELYSHDLGRPLGRVLERARALRAAVDSGGAVSPATLKDFIEETEAQAKSFRLMMSNVQVLTRLEDGRFRARPRPTDPLAVVEKIADRYYHLARDAGKQINVWSGPPELGLVPVDDSVIDHAVTNLVDNAVRFARRQVDIRIIREAGSLAFLVRDDGPGIAPEHIPYIFDHGWTPAATRREESVSSGFGLYIARTLAKRAGGELTVETSGPDAPVTFTEMRLTLPVRRKGR